MSLTYDLLKLYEPLYLINVKNGRETPEEAYRNNVEYCRCFDNCPNPDEYGDCGGCDKCLDNCYCDENKEPIDNKFNLISWMLFSFDEITSLFERTESLSKKESILFLKCFENNLKTKYSQKDKTNGRIIRECKVKIQELSKSNLNYRIKIAIIFEINRELRYGIESCNMLDGLSEVALQIFFENAKDDKNLNLFFKYDYKELLDYISDSKNNHLDKETSHFLYLCLNNSELFKNLMKIKNNID